ncbi:hypothetical protein [Ensifer sp. MJa1]|uniref:hypothetical protein n=1 Tax=Ensifer sp. MJa1 TaxID=2919888 RepID=UPI00300A5FB8
MNIPLPDAAMVERILELNRRGWGRDRNLSREMGELHRAAIEWFRVECLPVVVPSVPASAWRRVGHPFSGYGLEGQTVDHPIFYRFGRKKLDFVALCMPYANPALMSKSAELQSYGWKGDNDVSLEVTVLPREWSWWLPGSTYAAAVATPGLIVLPSSWI